MAHRLRLGGEINFKPLCRTIDPPQNPAALVAAGSVDPLDRRSIGLGITDARLLEHGPTVGDEKPAALGKRLKPWGKRQGGRIEQAGKPVAAGEESVFEGHADGGAVAVAARGAFGHEEAAWRHHAAS